MGKIFPYKPRKPEKPRLLDPAVAMLAEAQARERERLREERAVMRQLLLEAQHARLQQRAEQLALKSPPPEDDRTPFLIHIHEPEYVEAFSKQTKHHKAMLIKQDPEKYRPVKVAGPWLKAYQRGARAHCIGCGADITVTHKGNVPYEVVVISKPYQKIGGLCLDCKELPRQEKLEKIFRIAPLKVEVG